MGTAKKKVVILDTSDFGGRLTFRGPHQVEHIYDDDFEDDDFDEFDRVEDESDDGEILEDDYNKSIARQQDEVSLTFKDLEKAIAPVFFTLLGFAVRVYRIGINNSVVWDEAHFGKFGSYYLRNEFYHDVHPPLGKMLVGFSGYLAGYNGSWDFPSGETYPDHISFIKMRLFQAIFSSLCVPFAYYTAKEIGYGIFPTWLFTLMVAVEQSYVTLGKFILLDSMLLFFTVTTIYCFVKFHNENIKQSFSTKWWKWIILLGVSIGCVDSVKMVGLFATALVGIYVIIDLWQKFGDKSMNNKIYFYHWLTRIFALIFIPLSVFAFCFKVHFDLLWRSGTGDANMNSLFQANLVGSDVTSGPRDVTISSSKVTLKSQAMNGGLLHSHVQTYPEGSLQQQVTTYSHKDDNNNWIFEKPFDGWESIVSSDGHEYLNDNMKIRLSHPLTGANLHSHEIEAPISKKNYEVSGYGNPQLSDVNDYWIIEIVDQYGSENSSRIHPLTTSFRLRHEVLGCYLGTTGSHYPEWGFGQGEVACIRNPSSINDKSTWWNVEFHQNWKLESPTDFKLPKTSFWKDFIELNLAMMATNNALVPDSEKHDELASKWWQWPSLHTGIRLCGWDDETVKYYLIGSPATTWPSTLSVLIFPLIFLFYIFRWQRQYSDFSSTKKFNLFLMGGVYPMLGWGLHFMPFVIMGRVTYVHHYLPALYFAMLVYTYVFELTIGSLNTSPKKFHKFIYILSYLLNYCLIITIFWILRPLSFGMEGPNTSYKNLNWLPSWKLSDEKLWDWEYN